MGGYTARVLYVHTFIGSACTDMTEWTLDTENRRKQANDEYWIVTKEKGSFLLRCGSITLVPKTVSYKSV